MRRHLGRFSILITATTLIWKWNAGEGIHGR
jgi:hypothetical protein